jgi:hypothetical protein
MMMVLLLAAVELDPRSRRLTRYMAVLVVYLIMIFGYIIIWQIVFSVLCLLWESSSTGLIFLAWFYFGNFRFFLALLLC